MDTRAERKNYLTRDVILQLLSDEELARVSAREEGPPLDEGDEYIDLEDLRHCVRRMRSSTAVAIHDVLLRSTLTEATWTKICERLAASDAVR
jgi:hypothetical protein